MHTEFVNPHNGLPLRRDGDRLIDGEGNSFPVVAGVPRVCEQENYTSSFGRQWNLFQTTQIDGQGIQANPSEIRLFAETGWQPEELIGLDILEVGSGAGRFSRVILTRTRANLYSVDYSSAVEANLRNNGEYGAGRFHLAQASIYELPFPDDRFDKVLCLGVLQHTPDFEASVRALITKARPGGEIVVDFYVIKGWWTKLTAKYLLRPFTKRIPHDRLLGLIERNVDWLMTLSNLLERAKLGALRRFLPIVDFTNSMPPGLTRDELRQWIVLDTFDMFSPEYDNPQRLSTVAKMFERGGADVTFAGYIDAGSGVAAVVRGRKRRALKSS
jgi:SAM-dependent methyltransferase